MSYPRVGDLVAKDIRVAEVFRNLGIDFCCGGKQTVDKASEKMGLDPNYVMEQVEKGISELDNRENKFSDMSLTELADHIENKHHKFVRDNIDFIEPLLNKLMKVHGKRNPELYEIGDLFLHSINELSSHMKKEEVVLFPYIKAIESGNYNDINFDVKSAESPIMVLEHEHEVEGKRFQMISELSNNFTPPEGACNTYKLTYYKLDEFKKDLEEHIHLENNILFPKALELEKSKTN